MRGIRPTWLTAILISASIWAVGAVALYGLWLKDSPTVWIFLGIVAVFAVVATRISAAHHRRRAAAREISRRAEYEHGALAHGQVGLGVYGRYQPPDIR